MNSNYDKCEITSFVKACLREENITEISTDILRYSKKGDGYLSDVIFVHATGKAADESLREYNLVLKCSKKSKHLRYQLSTIFGNEIYIYDKVLSAFTEFQEARGIEQPFNSFPKFYGTFLTDDQEVIAFEDMTKSGYDLWNKTKPVTRKHVSLILEQYAKFHSISFAMKDQAPELYNKLTENFEELMKGFSKGGEGIVQNWKRDIKETHELLKDELNESILLEWKNFGERIAPDFLSIAQDFDGLNVIIHGDSWINNFMFKFEGSDPHQPLQLSLLDWQLARLGSPVFDLSHFLYSCLSGEDLNNLDNILEEYYKYFSHFLLLLKSDPEKLYPKEQFFNEWKKYGKIGIAMVSTVVKSCYADNDKLLDIAEAAEKGDFTEAFQFKLSDPTSFKNRMKHIVEYVVQNGLL